MTGDPVIAELINHLWQSTLFAAAAGLLTVALRKNGAHVRYWLWLTASVKFLVPFSLLVRLGGQLQWAPAAKNMAAEAVSYTMVQITQPFPDSVPLAPAAPRATDWLLIVIMGAWICGCGVIALMRLRDWLRIRAAVRASTPLEMPALAGAGVEVRSYPGLLEPGVVGLDVAGPFGFRWSRPILLLPAGIMNRLTRPQLEAVFAHELCHVRRRDNLTTAMHMVVETVFWFHPLVWWVGARLVEERERACDEEVLRQGGEPRIYAEAILNVCKFYVESPLACMSGVTGSDLKKRIERIMKERFGAALGARKKLLLVAAGVVALVLPIVAGSLTSSHFLAQSAGVSDWQAKAGGKMAFDVASIKPDPVTPSGETSRTNVPLGAMDDFRPTGGLFSATDVSLLGYIMFAYKLVSFQTKTLYDSLPTWATKTIGFDIQAHAPTNMNPTKDQFRLMMQALLADRFKLAVHYETKQLPVMALVLDKAGKLGPKIQHHPADETCSGVPVSNGSPLPVTTAAGYPQICGVLIMWFDGGRIHGGGRNIDLQAVANALTGGGFGIARPVLDRTGLTGNYDLVFDFTPETMPPGNQLDESGPTFLEALKDQLGLKLESRTGPVDVFVVDHVEEPSDNSGQAPAAQSPAAAQSAAAASGKVAFEVASVKPLPPGDRTFRFGFQPGGRFVSTVAVQWAISFAYNLPLFGNPTARLTGVPDWIRSKDAAYDIEATGVFPDGLSEEARQDRERLMVQALLADRFKLVIHRETKEMPAYALVLAKGSPKLQKADIEEKDCPDRSATPAPDPKTLCHALLGGGGRGFYARAVSISELANGFENYTDRPLVDNTGIKGLYHIETTPFRPMQVGPPPAPGAKAEDGTPLEDVPMISEVFEKLGLKMEPRKEKVDVYVIDRIERPSEN